LLAAAEAATKVADTLKDATEIAGCCEGCHKGCRSLSEQSLNELPLSVQPESTRKTQPFSEAVLSEYSP
ncbi:hypothetical protein Tco_0920877, partial [Tanacetum coccineum]